jgi:hypothetical protein
MRNLLLFCIGGLAGMALSADTHKAPPPAIPAEPADVVVLQMTRNRNWDGGGTIWRYYEAWQTDVVRKEDGKLVRVDPLNPRANYDPKKAWDEQNAGRNSKDFDLQLKETETIKGSPFPPADWSKPGFDDSRWVRTPIPMGSSYRSLALICLRGKFIVNDPSQVTELMLDAVIQGGAVVYCNGQEVGRFHLPPGKIGFDSPAEDYPKDAFVDSTGGLLGIGWDNSGLKNPDTATRWKSRSRTVSVKIPAAAIQKGVNVLAIEAHRAPAAEAMYTKLSPGKMGYGLSDNYGWFWNRVDVKELTLTAKAMAGAVAANTGRPGGVQVWNHPTWERVDNRFYGEPGDSLKPLRINGARSGTFSDQFVVSSTNAIKGLQVDVQASGGKVIPAAWVRVGYPGLYKVWNGALFEQIEDALPAAIPSVQPVWVTVDIPKDAKAGDYAATVTVRADGMAQVRAPVQLHVSDWALPPPEDCVTHMAFIQSPESVALSYGVPMWSKEHWALIEQSFKILKSVANKELNLPLVRRTHFGNEHGMVWFVRNKDGSYEPDFHVAEKYIEVASRQLVKIPVVVFYIIEADAEGRPWVTEFDPATGELKGIKGPPWGTPEARAFWNPVFAGLRAILAKHGLEKSLALGYAAMGGNGPEAPAALIADMKAVAPEARWVRVSHFWSGGGLEKGPGGNPWARVSLVAGNYGVGWDPETDKPFYGWLNPYPVTAYLRDSCFKEYSQTWVYRLAPEMVLLSGQRAHMAGWGVGDIAGEFGRDTFLGCRGFGPMGADFWVDVVARFNDPTAGLWDPRSCWSTVQLDNGGVINMVGRGVKGPVQSIRTESLREGVQEAEARVFCQNALLDEGQRTRLGPDLAKRCKDVCDDRTRALRYLSEFRAFGTGKGQTEQNYVFNPAAWQDLSVQLYDMAAEVAKALGK